METAHNPPRAEFIFDHVAHELPQVARNLGVDPQALLSLVNQGLLPATKIAKRSVLISDQDPCRAQRF